MARDSNYFWLGTLIGSVTLGMMPIFTNATVFAPVEIGAGAILMIVSLYSLRRPRSRNAPRPH
jgi:hypothetical protein